MTRRRRARPTPEPADFGPHERLARGEVRLEGDPARPRGRALSIVDELPVELLNSLSLLLRLFEAASFPGYAVSSLDRIGTGARKRDEPTERAEGARRHLAAIESHVGPLGWSAIVDLLLWQKSAAAWAFDCRTRGYAVDRNAAKPVLMTALAAIAIMRPPRRVESGRNALEAPG
jgi:hypothetical protein